MQYIYKFLNQKKPKLREFDPALIQRIKEGAYLIKVISETEIALRKLNYYFGICSDDEISKFFKEEAQKLSKVKKELQDYYETMTEE